MSTDAEPILQARGLVKHYGQVVALDGVDFPAPLSPMMATISFG